MKRTGVKTPETAPAPARFSGRKEIIPGFLRNRSQKAAVRLDPVGNIGLVQSRPRSLEAVRLDPAGRPSSLAWMNAPLPQDGPLHSLQFWAEIRSECRHKWIHILFLQQGKIFLLLPKTPVPQFCGIVLDPAVAGWLPFTQSRKHGPQGRSWSASVCGDPR